MWVNFARLSAQVVFAAWAGSETGFVKKCRGVAWQVDVPRFGLSLSAKYSLVRHFNNKLFFSFWRWYIIIYGHVILSLINEMGQFSKMQTFIKICYQGTKSDPTARSPQGQQSPSLLSVGGCGSLNHVMASLALPATTCRASQVSVRQAAGGAGAPQEGHSRMDPAAWAAMVNAEGLCLRACPWHGGRVSPPRFLVQCLFVQASHRDETFDPLWGSGWRRGISPSAPCWLLSPAIKAARGTRGSLFSSGRGFGQGWALQTSPTPKICNNRKLNPTVTPEKGDDVIAWGTPSCFHFAMCFGENFLHV